MLDPERWCIVIAAAFGNGVSSSPAGVSYTGNNRTHMVRIPDAQRLELRLPDGSAHPYLLQAAVLAAGSCTPLPASLGEALDAFAADTLLREALGESFCQAYERLRRRQWDAHRSEVTSWERSTGLDG